MANFFKKALPYLAGAAGQTVSAVVPGLNKYGAAMSAGAGALANKNNRAAGALQGFAGGGTSAALGGGIYGAMGKQGYGSNFGSGTMEGLKQFGGTIPGFGGIGTSNPTGVMAKFLTPQSIQGGAGKIPAMSGSGPMIKSGPAMTSQGFQVPSTVTPMSAFKPSSTGAVGAPAGSGATKTGFDFKDLISGGGIGGGKEDINLGMLGAGVGLPAVAGMMQKDYQAPDLSGQFAKVNDAIATNPQRTGAIDYMNKTLQAPIGADASAARAVSALRNQRQKEQDMKSLTQQFMAANPGADLSNNSAYQNALLDYNRDFLASEEAQNAQIQYQYDMAQRAQNVQVAKELGAMGDEQINVLLAEMGITAQQAIEKAQYDAGRGQAMTDFASTIGAELVKRGLGTPQPTIMMMPQTPVMR